MIPVLNAIRQACRNFANLFLRPQQVLPTYMPVGHIVITTVPTMVAARDEERVDQAAGDDVDPKLTARSAAYNAAETPVNGATTLPAVTEPGAAFVSSASLSPPVYLANTRERSVSAIVAAKEPVLAPPSAVAMSAPSLGPEVLEDLVVTAPAVAGAGSAARSPHAPASIQEGYPRPSIQRHSVMAVAPSFSLCADDVRHSEQLIFSKKIKTAFAERYTAASLPTPDTLLTSLSKKMITYIEKEIKGRIPDDLVLKPYLLAKDLDGINITSVSFWYRDTGQIFEAFVIRVNEDEKYVRLNIMSSKDFHAGVIKDILPQPLKLNRSAHSTGTTSSAAAAGVASWAKRRSVSLLGTVAPSGEMIKSTELAANAGVGTPSLLLNQNAATSCKLKP